MIEVRINNQNIQPLLAEPPRITDQLNGVCRTLDVTIKIVDSLVNYLGQSIELWYNNERWFIGFVRSRDFRSTGTVTYTAYDPMYFVKKNVDDWYFRYVTATQGFRTIAEKSGVRIASLDNTGVVFPTLLYQKAEGDKVAIDLLARTYSAGGRRYWFRYKPNANNDGLILFENIVPPKIWAFQVGVNLVSADYSESIADTATMIKLVDRETGKVVTRVDVDALAQYGPTVYFEEVNKDDAPLMESKAQELLKKLSTVTTTIKGEGINPNKTMPQLYSGDAIYIEEKYTGLLGGYYIRNITHTFENDNLISLDFEVTEAPDIPTIQYNDATTAATKTDKKKKSEDKGVQEGYSAEMQAAINKYGL